MRMQRQEFEKAKERCGVRSNTELAAVIYAEAGIAVPQNYFAKCFHNHDCLPVAYSAVVRLVAKLMENKGGGHAATA